MARHQRHAADACRLRVVLAQPGPGWHVLLRRLEAERAKKVAKILDPLGAGEKLPQHHGPFGRHAPNLLTKGPGLGTGALREGPD